MSRVTTILIMHGSLDNKLIYHTIQIISFYQGVMQFLKDYRGLLFLGQKLVIDSYRQFISQLKQAILDVLKNLMLAKSSCCFLGI